ncbi:metal-dependent hydrolase family protein [Sedimentimonas flavescens]|uniref:metal-dependent hydrolase family protein n=1 Tax=Sedimentimonas flavescens TaxID=2851012 RepID=UPI001C49E199|nr:amidohydrolase family protein [Sedimentimonas flavescens]MBW0159565.1 amidohydrolase family protein [Sedimentimonas flavescens]MCT2538956.1 amidohydrolase family protein [Sedimentimonas flavescens]WBL32209.1 amidohydrolase family protein [Sinirhodobacter sp. HNIBRBA609]
MSTAICTVTAIATICAPQAQAQSAENEPNAVLIRGAKIFTGCSPDLIEGQDVFIAGNLISRIGADIEAPDFATVIEADGRVLMPGLIDAHWHGVFAEATILKLFTTTEGYWNLLAARASSNALHRGFTTLRDTAGPMFDVARAFDEGLIDGPRIFPSGPALSQTSGHQDFRLTREVPQTSNNLDTLETGDMFYIADGVDEVLKRTRENLMQGATQIKLMAGGGVTSSYDPLHTVQYTQEELKAAVTAAAHWGTYVLTHAITDEAVNHSLDAGVKSIEHGHTSTRETLQRIKDEGAWLSMQPFLNDDSAPALNAFQQEKYDSVANGTEFVYTTGRELGVKFAFGTDILFDPELAKKQGAILAKLGKWFTPYEALKMATCDNAELLKLSGPLTPYPLGPLGVVEEGAYADLLLVDGNPLENLDLVSDPVANFDLIMKDGVIYKNEM